jgi:hypothetical protein
MALAGALLLALAGPASAHQASVSATCDGGISINYSSFPEGQSTINYAVTDNGAALPGGAVTVTGPQGSASASFTAPTTPGPHAIAVTVSWTVDGGGSATGGADCPVEQPPPPKNVQVCREGKMVTIPETEPKPGEVEGKQCEVVPPVENETVCRNGDLITIPKTEELPTDTDTCVQPETQVCVGGETMTVPFDRVPVDSTAGECQDKHVVLVDQPQAEHHLGPPLTLASKQTPGAPEALPFTGSSESPWGLLALGVPVLTLGYGIRRKLNRAR